MYGFVVFVAVLNFILPSLAVDPNCDFYQQMVIGQDYYIYNQQYPKNYPPSTSCRWIAQSPANSIIVLTCDEIVIPATPNCQGDKLIISLTGSQDLQDGHNYCGTGNLNLVTEANALTIGLTAASNSPGGRFICKITAQATGPKPPTCNCGYRMQKKIVGGQETPINGYPSMGALLDLETGDLACGASIISPQYVVTAAHCLLHKKPIDLGILVGDHNISSGADTSFAAVYRFISFIPHPDYNVDTQENDIAVLKTTQDIKFSIAVGPVCLPFNYHTDFNGQQVIALGWGFLQYSGPMSDVLQEVILNVVSNQQCAQQLSQQDITPDQLCTFARNKDACQGDSGGPVLWQDPNTRRLQLVGIISSGLGCASDSPGVNTRITAYINWIVAVTPDAHYCEA